MLILVSLVTMVPMITEASGGCSAWRVYSVSNAYCKKMSCGFLGWYDTALVQNLFWEKTCVDAAGNVTNHYKMTVQKLECGC